MKYLPLAAMTEPKSQAQLDAHWALCDRLAARLQRERPNDVYNFSSEDFHASIPHEEMEIMDRENKSLID